MTEKGVIIITGASSGIGAATARRLGREGYRLVLLARRLEQLKKIEGEIGARVESYALDVCGKEEVFARFEEIGKKDPIEALINNAGCAFGLEPAHRCNIEEWEQCIDVNIKGLLYCTRAVLPFMVERNRGHIINLGSVAGHYPYPGGNVYGATKAFVYQFSLNLRADLLGTHVRVSCIEPGLTTGTEFSTVRFKGDKMRAAGVYAHTYPLQAEDIAETIYFCLNLPEHVNINTVEVMPVMQAFAPLAVYRTKETS